MNTYKKYALLLGLVATSGSMFAADQTEETKEDDLAKPVSPKKKGNEKFPAWQKWGLGVAAVLGAGLTGVGIYQLVSSSGKGEEEKV